jgi:arabinosyltransferase B
VCGGVHVWSTRRRPTMITAPAMVVVIASGTAISLLLGSFVAAPLRRPEGSLALANLNRLTGARVCGLADDIEVLRDGPTLAAADSAERSDGFTAMAGYPISAPPPEPPGTGASKVLWGSVSAGPQSTGSITTRWFTLPRLGPDGGVAVSVLGRTDGANTLRFELGRSSGSEIVTLGERVPADRPAIDEDPAHPLWRAIGIDASAIPPDADRIRIRAVDGRADDSGYLVFTGPRLRTVLGLNEFLTGRGPVLIGWPQAFLFPCVLDIAEVSIGVAQTPRVVIESPRPFFAEYRDPHFGGTFAGLTGLGELQEIPSRLRGHPDVDWGTVLIVPAGEAHDGYLRTVTRETRWGFDHVGQVRAER